MNTIEESNAPVLVVAKGVPVHFASPLYVA
jgi:hypothetical protein